MATGMKVEKFQNVLGRFETKRFSTMDTAELLEMSEPSCRQHCEEGGLEGLFDRRLGKASTRRVPVDRIMRVPEEYRTRRPGWAVKHFRDRHGFTLGYTWTNTTLQRARPASARHQAHRRLLPRSERSLRTRLRHPPGPSCQGARPRRHHHRRGCQLLHQGQLPTRPSPPRRDADRARGCSLRTAVPARADQ